MNCEIITANTVAGMKNPMIEKADGKRSLSIDILVNICKHKNLDPQYEELFFVLDIYLFITS